VPQVYGVVDMAGTMKAAKDPSFRLLAARYLGKQARKLAKQLDGACRADNHEFVHQARVASRRIRAALQLFRDCFQRKQWKRWQKHIRRITSGLGAARDRDVQVDYLCRLLAGLGDQAHVPGIARLLVDVEREREALQPRVVEAVEKFQRSGVLKEIRKVTNGIIKRQNGKEVSLQSRAAVKQARKTIRQHLDALVGYQDCLDEPEDSEQHHAMRIAAKRLRYTVEISDPVYDGALSDHLKVIKQVQTLLGDLHDCDVWAEDLREFARAEKKRIAARFGDDGPYERLRPGIEHLAQIRLEQRAAIFAELVAYWKQLEGDKRWDLLRAAIEPRGKRASRVETAEDKPAEQADSHRGKPRNLRPHAASVSVPHGNGSGSAKRRAEPVGS